MNPTTFAMAEASYGECSLARSFLVARVRPRVDEKVAAAEATAAHRDSMEWSCARWPGC
jgi:hypothetical protein